MISLKNNDPVELLESAQDVTSGWVTVGEVISVGNKKSIALWIDYTANDSLSTQIQILAGATSGGVEHNIPIQTVGASEVEVAPWVLTLSDANQKIVLPVELSGQIPFILVQVKAGTVGSTAGSFDSIMISYCD